MRTDRAPEAERHHGRHDGTPPEGDRADGGPEPDDEVCRQVLQILGLIGDKWSILVVGQLRDRTLRFSELHRSVTGSPSACSPGPCGNSNATVS